MQRKDLLRFALVAIPIIILMIWMQSRIPKPQPPPDKKPEVSNLDEDRKNLAPTRSEEAFGMTGSLGGLLASRELSNLPFAKDEKNPAFTRLPSAQRALGLAVGGAWVAAEKKPPVPQRPDLISLGSDDPNSPFHLQVTFDPLGACVRRVVLNKFRKANHLGRRDDGVIELVPDDTALEKLVQEASAHPRPRLGSNVLYHFDVNDPTYDRPLTTLSDAVWQVEKAEGKVSFTTEIQGVRITKTFSLAPGEYHVGLEVKLKAVDPAAKNLKFRYQLSGARGLPIEGRWYTTTFRNALIAEVKDNDLWRTMKESREISQTLGGKSVGKEHDGFLQYAGVAVQYFASVIVVDDTQDKRDFLRSATPTLETRALRVELEGPLPASGFLAFGDKRKPKDILFDCQLSDKVLEALQSRGLTGTGAKFGLECVPRPQTFGSSIGAEPVLALRVLSEAETQPLFLDDVTVRVNTEPVELGGDKEVVHKYLLYNGPVKPKLLGQMSGIEEVNADLVKRYVKTLHLNTLTDYQTSGALGSFSSSIFWTDLLIFFTNLMHDVLNLLHSIVPNYGICIILLTLIVRGMMFPLSRKQALMSIKMQELAPELRKLKEKYPDDMQARHAAMMAMYRKHGVKPLGSCWILLLQMPVFMGLYYCLQESVHFRLGSFLWIDNLAAPDMLIPWGEHIPMLSRPEDYGGLLYLGPYFNLLPILAVTCMVLQQKMFMPPPADDQQAMQQKMMKWMMIIFGIFFYRVAAGLCLYFITSTVWGFMERKLLPKKPTTTPGPAPSTPESAPAPGPAPIAPPPPQPGAIRAADNRARRRQDRKKRQQERGGPPPSAFTSEAPDRAVETPKEENGEGGGWWSRFRRKFGNWWKDLLKKAAKK